MTSRSGQASLMARVASWTTPSSSQAPEPSASLWAGHAEEQHAGEAERLGLAGLGDGAVDGVAHDAGHGLDRLGWTPGRCVTNSGQDQVRGVDARLAHEPPQGGGAAQAAQAGLRGKAISPPERSAARSEPPHGEARQRAVRHGQDRAVQQRDPEARDVAPLSAESIA